MCYHGIRPFPVTQHSSSPSVTAVGSCLQCKHGDTEHHWPCVRVSSFIATEFISIALSTWWFTTLHLSCPTSLSPHARSTPTLLAQHKPSDTTPEEDSSLCSIASSSPPPLSPLLPPPPPQAPSSQTKAETFLLLWQFKSPEWVRSLFNGARLALYDYCAWLPRGAPAGLLSQLFISPVPLLCHPMPAPLLPCSPNINLQTRHLRKIPPFAQLHPPHPRRSPPPPPPPPTSAPSTVLPNEGRNIFAAWAVQISRVGEKFVQWGAPGSLWLLCLTPEGRPCRITVASCFD